MPENIQSAMFEILKRIQSDISELKSDVSTLKADMSDLKTRVERMEKLVKRQGRDSAAMLVMFRGTVGVYDERMKDIEEDVRPLMEAE